MGTKYTTQTQSGFNSSPPPDDGSVSSANKVTWATIKTKICDPILTLAQAINTALVTALDASPTLQTTNYTTLVSDNGKPINVTGTTTILLGDATTMGVGYSVPIVNTGANTVTVGVATNTDTLDGTANGTAAIPPNGSMTFSVNSGHTGYNTLSVAPSSGTWTPVMNFGGGVTGITYSAQAGFYTKIGNRVIINGKMTLSSKGSSTGIATILGLPFTSNSTANNYCAVALQTSSVATTNGWAQAFIAPASVSIALEYAVDAGTASVALTDAYMANVSSFMFNATYMV